MTTIIEFVISHQCARIIFSNFAEKTTFKNVVFLFLKNLTEFLCENICISTSTLLNANAICILIEQRDKNSNGCWAYRAVRQFQCFSVRMT